MSFCRCKYTAREEYAPALLKHRLDEKLKIYGFTRKTTLLLSVLSWVLLPLPLMRIESLRCVLAIGVAVLCKYRPGGQVDLGLHSVTSLGYCQDVGEGTRYE
jgi:hypothetical protein